MKKGHRMSEYERICHHFPIKRDRPKMSTIRRIKERLGYECQICGEKDKYVIELHHIVPLAVSGKNDINNFVCLCANCHRRVHSPLGEVSLMTA